MPTDTNPLPAAQLLALADAMDTAFTAWEDRYQHHGIDEPGHDPDGPDLWEQFTIAREAYRAARAASPGTLEEHLLIDFVKAPRDHNGSSAKFCGALQRLEKHARRLAGEGGGL